MFERFFVREDSLRNVVENGEVVGFSIAVRNANYRGVFLSLHNGYFIEMDGVSYKRDVQRFEINGKPPRDFTQIASETKEHWDYDDEGILHIRKPGGLSVGSHKLRIQQSVLAAYGYRPTDEDWVKTPPEPGTGAGSDKAPEISEFEMVLTVEGDQA